MARDWKRPADGNPRALDEDEARFIYDSGQCPFCRSGKGLAEGPRGGASVNLFCNDPDCDSRFNVIDPAHGFVPFAQFTGPCPPEFLEGLRLKAGRLH